MMDSPLVKRSKLRSLYAARAAVHRRRPYCGFPATLYDESSPTAAVQRPVPGVDAKDAGRDSCPAIRAAVALQMRCVLARPARAERRILSRPLELHGAEVVS